MSNSKFWLLALFFLTFALQLFADTFSKDEFIKNYNNTKFNIKAAINNLKFLETKANYKHYFKKHVIKHSFECFRKNKKIFISAYDKFKVSPYIILGILTIETHCGKHHSQHKVIEIYKTLITLKLNKKLSEKVFKILKEKYHYISKKWFLKRVDKKYKWAKRQIAALKKIYLEKKINIFNLEGSWAGAFGYPQFIPTSFLIFAVDGNNDGYIDLFNYPDSIFSIANYLKKNGWNEKASYKRKLRVIYTYNHSKLYCETVIKLAKIFRELDLTKKHL